MLQAEVQHPEGGRYAAPLVLVPDLWVGPAAWRAVASFLAHRGWESRLVDLRSVRGGAAARGRALARYGAGLEAPPVLIGHGAGGLAVLAAAGIGPAAAAVLVAPLVPGSAGARSLAPVGRAALRMLLGRAVPPPRDPERTLRLAGLPAAARARILGSLGAEAARTVRETLVRPRRSSRPGIPTLVVAVADDPLTPHAEARELARDLDGECLVLEAGGHWPIEGATWQPLVGLVHRWIVRALGAPLLEHYAEAMAEREENEDPEAGG